MSYFKYSKRPLKFTLVKYGIFLMYLMYPSLCRNSLGYSCVDQRTLIPKIIPQAAVIEHGCTRSIYFLRYGTRSSTTFSIFLRLAIWWGGGGLPPKQIKYTR